jgi:hypothetical protein
MARPATTAVQQLTSRLQHQAWEIAALQATINIQFGRIANLQTAVGAVEVIERSHSGDNWFIEQTSLSAPLSREEKHPVAIDLCLDVRRKWLFARAHGSLSIEETITFIRTARAKIERRMWPLLFDARACRTRMTDGDIEQAVEAVRESARRGQQRGHVALVADDDVLYRRFLLYETECAGIGVGVIRVFRRLEHAGQWLETISHAVT